MGRAVNPYKILNVSRDADDETITKAYRREASKAHPDRASVDEDPAVRTKRMQEVNDAYAILSDPERRADYDQYGTADTAERIAVERAITNMFLSYLDQPEDMELMNIIETLRAQSKQRMLNLRNEIVDLRRKMNKRDRIVRRIIRKGEGKNAIAMAIEKSIAVMLETIDTLEDDITFTEKVLDELQHYEYIVDEREDFRAARLKLYGHASAGPALPGAR